MLLPPSQEAVCASCRGSTGPRSWKGRPSPAGSARAVVLEVLCVHPRGSGKQVSSQCLCGLVSTASWGLPVAVASGDLQRGGVW